MKLSDVKPCACCGGPLLVDQMQHWYEFRVSMVIINQRATQQVLGVMAILGGVQALGIAEAMASTPEAVMVMGEHDKELYTQAHICFRCYRKPLAEIHETVSQHQETTREKSS